MRIFTAVPLFSKQQYDPRLATPIKSDEAIHDDKKETYNYIHASARSSGEQTNGIVKRRYPILHYGLPFRSLKKCEETVLCLYAVHNFILDNSKDVDEFSFL